MAKASIIVFIHEAEDHIEKCLDSLFGQSFSDIEYIFVNSNTMDNSISLLKKALDKEPRGKLIHLPRDLGSGAARREGIREATGEYILFVDATDWIESDMVKRLIQAVEAEGADYAFCAFARVDPNSGEANKVEPFYSAQAEWRCKAGVIDLVQHRNILFDIDPATYLTLHRRKLLQELECGFAYPQTANDDRLHYLCGFSSTTAIYVDMPLYHRRETSLHQARRMTDQRTREILETLTENFSLFDIYFTPETALRAKVTVATRALGGRLRELTRAGKSTDAFVNTAGQILASFSDEDFYLDVDSSEDETTLKFLTSKGRRKMFGPESNNMSRNEFLISTHMTFQPFEPIQLPAAASVLEVRFNGGWADIVLNFVDNLDISEGRVRSFVEVTAAEPLMLRFALMSANANSLSDDTELNVFEIYRSFSPGLNVLVFGPEDLVQQSGCPDLKRVNRIQFGGVADTAVVRMSLAYIDINEILDLVAVSAREPAGTRLEAMENGDLLQPVHFVLNSFESFLSLDGMPHVGLSDDMESVQAPFSELVQLDNTVLRMCVTVHATAPIDVCFCFLTQDNNDLLLERKMSPGDHILVVGLNDLSCDNTKAEPVVINGVKIRRQAGVGKILSTFTLVSVGNVKNLLPTEYWVQS